MPRGVYERNGNFAGGIKIENNIPIPENVRSRHKQKIRVGTGFKMLKPNQSFAIPTSTSSKYRDKAVKRLVKRKYYYQRILKGKPRFEVHPMKEKTGKQVIRIWRVA